MSRLRRAADGAPFPPASLARAGLGGAAACARQVFGPRGGLRGEVEDGLVVGLHAADAAHACQEVFRRLVPRRGGEGRFHPRQPPAHGDRPQVRQHGVLDPPAQDAAAQQHRVDPQGVAVGAENEDAHQAVLPEPIRNLDSQAFKSSSVQVAGLRLCAAHRRQVELVGALRQLRDARPFVLGRGGDVHAEPQPGQELSDAGGLALEAAALGVLPVHQRPPPVLLGATPPVEGPHVAQEIGNVRVVGRELQRQNLGQGGAHFRTFQRVVIDKNEGVQAQVQLGGQLRQGLRLGPPADSPGGEVLRPQRRLGTLPEDREDVRLRVLADQAEEHALLLLLNGELLQARLPGVSDTPWGPSSPTTPCHSVLSQSSASTLYGTDRIRWIRRAAAVARAA